MTPEYDSDFLRIFHNNLVGMVLTDEQHLITDINENLLALIGLTKEHVIGKTALAAGVLNEDNIKHMWQQLAEKGELINAELAFKTIQNKPLTVLLSTEKILVNGSVHWLTSVVDISERKKTERALSEMYERVSDGFIAIDRNWNYKYVNKRAGELLGKDPAYLIGKHMWTEFPQQETNPFYKAYYQAMESQEMLTVEEYVEAYGRWFQNLVYPAADGLSVFFRDITDAKENEKRIAESEIRFKTLTRTAPVGIFETDANGLTTYVNETWMQYSGMRFEEAMGNGWLNAVHPDDRDWLQKSWYSKTEMKSESFSEYRIVDKEGKIRWLNGRAVPVFNNEGLVSGYIGITLDVTEKKISEQRIINSEESKRLILNSALDAIIIVDSASKIIFWNPQAENIFGWKADEVIGKSLVETIIPAEYKDAHQRGMQHYLQTGEGPILNRLIEVTACDKAGILFPIELSILPVEQETGRSFCAFIRNITERKQAESSLKESSKQLRELSRHLQRVREEERLRIAREIHDELGQQLTGLKMDIAWLMRKTGQEDAVIKDKFDNALLLVDNTVRSIRRISTELRPSVLDDLGLNAALEWQVGELGRRMVVEIEYGNSFDDTNIHPDISIGIFRILQESLTNIVRHASAKKVKVNIAQQDHTIRLTIEDDGIGFDTQAKKDQLTFGLIGIKERTSMLQGECAIYSQPGLGTRIEVCIPLGRT
ncbi:MAG: PAS domain S-box protein [Ferruginibacter sp.]